MKLTVLRTGGALLLATVALTFAGCTSSAQSPTLAGTWGEPGASGKPALEFTPASGESGGEYGGNDGCNTIGGEYTVTDGTVEFGMMRATMMFCEGVDTWLSQAHTATLEGDTLTVLDEQGAEIGTLERAQSE